MSKSHLGKLSSHHITVHLLNRSPIQSVHARWKAIYIFEWNQDLYQQRLRTLGETTAYFSHSKKMSLLKTNTFTHSESLFRTSVSTNILLRRTFLMQMSRNAMRSHCWCPPRPSFFGDSNHQQMLTKIVQETEHSLKSIALSWFTAFHGPFSSTELQSSNSILIFQNSMDDLQLKRCQTLPCDNLIPFVFKLRK